MAMTARELAEKTPFPGEDPFDESRWNVAQEYADGELAILCRERGFQEDYDKYLLDGMDPACSFIKLAHAWVICFYVTFTLQELSERKVVVSSEQYGDGKIVSTGEANKIKLRKQFRENADRYLPVDDYEIHVL